MAVIIIGDDALEELRRELARPGPGERGTDDTRAGEERNFSLPCADMTCPCRIVRK